MNDKYEHMSWSKFDEGCRILANSIKDKYSHVDNVYGIPRGGLMLAIRLCYLLNITLNRDYVTVNTIIVDDISDTGKTLLNYKYHPVPIATLYYHKDSKVIPNLWVYEKKDKWIVFPWEKV